VRSGWPFLGIVSALGVAADQWTKRLAEQLVAPRGIVTVIPGALDLRFARNPGAFFSLGASLEPGLRRVVLVLASSVVMTLLLRLYAQTRSEQRRLRCALALLLAGAIGNLIDRARSGEVTDFVYLHVGAWLHWATFNVADVLITAGLVLLAIDALSKKAGVAASRPQSAVSERR